jgi:hypothetical protein
LLRFAYSSIAVAADFRAENSNLKENLQRSF